ncbi:unnamed protein product, partial [Didymodactylos carnosus]
DETRLPFDNSTDNSRRFRSRFATEEQPTSTSIQANDSFNLNQSELVPNRRRHRVNCKPTGKIVWNEVCRFTVLD